MRKHKPAGVVVHAARIHCLLVVSLSFLLFRVLISMRRRVLRIVLLHDGLMRLVLVIPAM